MVTNSQMKFYFFQNCQGVSIIKVYHQVAGNFFTLTKGEVLEVSSFPLYTVSSALVLDFHICKAISVEAQGLWDIAGGLAYIHLSVPFPGLLSPSPVPTPSYPYAPIPFSVSANFFTYASPESNLRKTLVKYSS